ncbi:hypothetical protein Tco_0783395 [Tanacetum coccineum]
MAAPLSPNHVFDFLADEPHNFDDSDLEFEEEPKEEPEEENKEEVKRLRDDTEILFSGVRCLERGARTRQAKIDANRSGINKLSGRMDAFNTNLGFIERDATRTSDYVLVSERLGWGVMEARPSDSNDMLAVYGAAQPPEP